MTENITNPQVELTAEQSDRLQEMFKRAYYALVRIFVYTVGELSKSLPESDDMNKVARLLRPTANKLLASIDDQANQEQPSEQEVSELLDDLITSGNAKMAAVTHLSLLPIVQKMRMYRSLMFKVNPARKESGR